VWLLDSQNSGPRQLTLSEYLAHVNRHRGAFALNILL
jgi:hypothetical protein